LAEARRQTPSTPPAGAAARAAAATVVQAVRDRGRSLTDALEQLPPLADERDRGLVQELAFGVVRQLPRLSAVADQLFERPPRRTDGDIAALVLVGLHQLASTRVPEHAAVAATVEAARRLGKPRMAGLVNALLRRFLREREALLARAEASDAGRWLFPDWLLGRLRRAWPEHWEAIASASNAHPPMTLRVNTMAISRTDYANRLAAEGLAARPTPHARDGLDLDDPVPVARLPGFAEGLLSVQDAGAQLAAALLDATPGERVLDACAAPGGKTAHLLERAGNRLDLTAVDADAKRLDRVRGTLARLHLEARVAEGDAAAPAGDWAEGPYHRILLDAPCSATGVIRRHPDIKWLRRESDVAALAGLQARMLDALWPLLAPGGTLLYVTCSLLPEENDGQVRAFLGRRHDAREVPIDAAWGLPRNPGRQILSGEDGMDGFYYARLRKAAA
jgi:16S rRNA (cytosine967-C5)-methyltransferase